MSHPPLPKPDYVLVSGPHFYKDVAKTTWYWNEASTHARADTVLAAARDCRTCRWHNSDDKYWCDMDCTDANRYEPLPPVRLWRKK